MTTEERENKRLQVRAGGVEDRGSEGQRRTGAEGALSQVMYS